MLKILKTIDIMDLQLIFTGFMDIIIKKGFYVAILEVGMRAWYNDLKILEGHIATQKKDKIL